MLIGIDANEANLTAHRVGVNQYAFDLLWAIYNLHPADEFVIYLKTPPLADLPPARQNWSYRVLPFKRLWTQTRLPFDLYFHRPRPDIFLSLTHYAPRWSPVPVVVCIMDIGFLKFPEQFSPRDFNQLKNWTAYSVKKATKIIAISQHTKADLIQQYHLPESKITVTYPGYDEQLFHHTQNLEILSKYNITRPYILFLSSLKPSKNVEGLLTAFSQFPHSDYQLIVAGKKAWMYDAIFSRVQSLGLEKRVIFTGFIEESEVPVLMSHASAYVLPSFYEGFGIPVLEAMACETPVVISRVASLPEVAGNAGIYIDPQDPDSISKGLETAIGPKRGEFVKLGLSRLKLFHWPQTAQDTLAVLASIKA